MAVFVSAGVAAALFAQGWLRLRGRGRRDLADRTRAALFGSGLVVVVLALVGPVHELAERHLWVHMLQHVLIGDLGIALTVLAVRGPLLVFTLPPRVLGPIARSPVRAALSVLLRPPVAFSLWAVNLAVWHVPSFYDAAVRHQALHDFEHACWIVAGLLVWTLLIDPGSHHRLSVGGRVALAVAMFAAGQVLTDLLVFWSGPLYPLYRGEYDQKIAGLVMMAEQLLTLGTLVFVLIRPRLRHARLAAA